VAIHAPRDFPGSDSRNFHAHLLATTREVTTKGLGAKTTVEMHDRRRREAGLDSGVRELLDVRKSWADAANRALQAAHIDARIDHRTLAAQGIDREPAPHIPRAVFEMERRGQRTVVAEGIRQQYQARVEARLQRAAQRSPTPARASEPKLSPDELRRQSAENWRRYREAQPKLSLSPKDPAKQSAERWRRWRETQPKLSLSSKELAKRSAEKWRRWRETQPKLSLSPEDPAKQSAEKWRRWRETQPNLSLSPEDPAKRSAENWRRYREAHRETQPKQLSPDELRRQSVEKWLRYREERSKSKSQSPSKSRARERDHDHSL
jgi:hypothetical protein